MLREKESRKGGDFARERERENGGNAARRCGLSVPGNAQHPAESEQLIRRNILTEMHEATLHISSVSAGSSSLSAPRKRSSLSSRFGEVERAALGT